MAERTWRCLSSKWLLSNWNYSTWTYKKLTEKLSANHGIKVIGCCYLSPTFHINQFVKLWFHIDNEKQRWASDELNPIFKQKMFLSHVGMQMLLFYANKAHEHYSFSSTLSWFQTDSPKTKCLLSSSPVIWLKWLWTSLPYLKLTKFTTNTWQPQCINFRNWWSATSRL